jgi:hypothetical protein
MIQLGCLRPSSGPTGTCVASPLPSVKTGAQITDENFESMTACRLTTTNVRARFGSPSGFRTRYNSPRRTALG